MYDGKTDTIRASTRPNPQKGREGSQLNLSDKLSFIEEWMERESKLQVASEELKGGRKADKVKIDTSPGGESKSRVSWQKFIESKVAGYMQSRLYGGS